MSDYEKKIAEMEEEEMLEPDVLELVGDDGEVANFYHIATLEYKKEWYVVLQPVEETEDISEEELVIFGLGTDEAGEDIFVPVESEEVLSAVYAEYVKLVEQDEEISE